MASTPSASALSAVLRCRGNILARNQANKKRPVTSGYSLGLACGAVCESSTERTRSNNQFPSIWESIFKGQQVVFRKGLSVVYKSESDGKAVRNEPVNNSCQGRLSESRTCAAGGTRSLNVPSAQSELLRKHEPLSTHILSGTTKCLRFIVFSREFKYDIASKNYENMFWGKCNRTSPGVLCISLTLYNSKEMGKQMIHSFIINGWSTLKHSCASFTLLLSEIMHLKLGALFRSRTTNVGEPAMETRHLIRGRNTFVKKGGQQGESLTGQSGSPIVQQPLTDNHGQRTSQDRQD